MRHADYGRPIAVITGATSGIGAEFARRFAEKGYDLVVTGRRKDKISQLVKDLEERYGTQVETILCELSNPDHLDRLVRRLSEKDDIAILVNNAGFGIQRRFAESEVDGFLAMVRVHVETTVRLVHAVLPAMRRRQRGAIINVSSLMSALPAPGSAVYSGTKAFLTLFSESLHMELRPDNIHIQALLPGFTRTDFHDQMLNRELETSSSRFRSRGLLRFLAPAKVVQDSLNALKRGKV
ncbi:MAG TPA: SDR family oxidoreductase, partial [Spirochaetia bacterium]|nr:SDR family oxidoreductase [Spirochaetia bacterium]